MSPRVYGSNASRTKPDAATPRPPRHNQTAEKAQCPLWFPLWFPQQTVQTTDDHPFWVAGFGWRDAAFLRVGDELQQANSDTVTVVNSERRLCPDGIAVFNFEVERFHSYFVAEYENAPAVLVHNASYGQILNAVKSGNNIDADNVEEGLHAVKRGLDDLGGGRAQFLGILDPPAPNNPYPSTAGVDKWFRIEGAEPSAGNMLPHIKFQDNINDVSGHVWISEEDYNSLINMEGDLFMEVMKFWDQNG